MYKKIRIFDDWWLIIIDKVLTLDINFEFVIQLYVHKHTSRCILFFFHFYSTVEQYNIKLFNMKKIYKSNRIFINLFFHFQRNKLWIFKSRIYYIHDSFKYCVQSDIIISKALFNINFTFWNWANKKFIVYLWKNHSCEKIGKWNVNQYITNCMIKWINEICVWSLFGPIYQIVFKCMYSFMLNVKWH